VGLFICDVRGIYRLPHTLATLASLFRGYA
jgi:hypothetical protein